MDKYSQMTLKGYTIAAIATAFVTVVAYVVMHVVLSLVMESPFGPFSPLNYLFAAAASLCFLIAICNRRKGDTYPTWMMTGSVIAATTLFCMFLGTLSFESLALLGATAAFCGFGILVTLAQAKREQVAERVSGNFHDFDDINDPRVVGRDVTA
jgi:hypothetical protein